ncbi:MAG: nickel pincer cofactor biosynthesis protein LarB [Anaerolineae bacterium]|nr:nickel pincer cofactor biosynthesis protein LarB [Anaerolineae bacterium]MDW8102519.1 nickel pincer cofactor biosynthesis protein LarB [Anaerolineae bacterium]
MDREKLRRLLEEVREGQKSVEEALEALRGFPFEDLEFARLDTHRALRKGFPEVIFCPGKTPAQVVELMRRLYEKSGRVMATRAFPEVVEAVTSAFPEARYFPEARIVFLGQPAPKTGRGTVLVITAGTADIPVAEEAAVTAELLGSSVERLYDVGVAGLHRLIAYQDKLFSANVIVVVAGMEGALPSVVGGLVARPVVAVPTSVGYGAHWGGLASLLTMLNTCAPGVVVVNIDNGFGAGYVAHLINQ